MTSIHDCCYRCGESLVDPLAPKATCADHRVGDDDHLKVADDPDEVESITNEMYDVIERAIHGVDIVR